VSFQRNRIDSQVSFFKNEDMEPIVVFIARSSTSLNGRTCEATHEFLLRSLQFTQKAYEKTYGTLSQDPIFLTFIQSSEDFRPRGQMVTRLLEILNTARETSRSITMVVNGWDGIFTNPFVFADLFKPYCDIEIKLRFFVDVPRVFREADAQAAVKLLTREIDADEAPFDTAEFVKNIQIVSFIKQNLSDLRNQLIQTSHNRNTPPDWHLNEDAPARYTCDQCNAGFDKSLHLVMHKRNNHSNESEEEKTCRYCGKIFARKDVRVRHEDRLCSLKPGYVRPPPRTLKRPLPSASGSTNGFVPYAEIQQHSDEWPAIDAENPLIYRGEVFCRWSGCQRKVSMKFLPAGDQC
jgi:hypothetical protein